MYKFINVQVLIETEFLVFNTPSFLIPYFRGLHFDFGDVQTHALTSTLRLYKELG